MDHAEQINQVQQREHGIINVPSPHSVLETIAKLEAVLAAKGIPVLARISHSDGAAAAGLTMKPTELIIFGNAKAGTPIMLAAPSAAIDLPLKALVWQDENNAVWVTYNAPEYLQERHGFPEQLVANLAGIKAIVEAATKA